LDYSHHPVDFYLSDSYFSGSTPTKGQTNQ
jgi:hypothetical protein